MTAFDPVRVAETAFRFAGQHWKIIGLTAAALLLLYLARRAAKSDRPDQWISVLAVLVGFAWSGEAMWEVATQRLHVGIGFAVLAFLVFESQLATAMMRAERHKNDRKRRDRHIAAAQRVAIVAGFVVVFAADSPVEMVLRPAIPLLVVYQWRVGLTDTDEGSAEPSTWLWTPARFAVWIGAKKPGEESLTDAQRRQQIGRMVKAADTVALGGRGSRRAALRLRKMARVATPDMVAEVARQQRQAANATALMVSQDDGDKPGSDLPEDTESVATSGDSGSDSLSSADATDGACDSDTGATGDATVQRHDGDTTATAAVTLPRQVTRQPKRQVTRQNPTAERVAKILAVTPGVPTAVIAKRLKVSERTVQRYMPKPDDHGPVNGRVPDLEAV